MGDELRAVLDKLNRQGPVGPAPRAAARGRKPR